MGHAKPLTGVERRGDGVAAAPPQGEDGEQFRFRQIGNQGESNLIATPLTVVQVKLNTW